MGELDWQLRVPASPIDLLDPSRCFAKPEGAATKHKKEVLPKAERAGSKRKMEAGETPTPKVLVALPKPTRVVVSAPHPQLSPPQVRGLRAGSTLLSEEERPRGAMKLPPGWQQRQSARGYISGYVNLEAGTSARTINAAWQVRM